MFSQSNKYLKFSFLSFRPLHIHKAEPVPTVRNESQKKKQWTGNRHKKVLAKRRKVVLNL